MWNRNIRRSGFFYQKMSSAICQNFVQNAWKKELCSNCFKSKDEHCPPPKPKVVTLVSSRAICGIIRDPNKVKTKLNVEFTKELSQFIGYGGEDWLSAEEEEDIEINSLNDSDDNLDDDLLTDSDEEDQVREMRLQTKKNTNYNTVSLAQVVEEKKSYAHLMLGKPVVNSEGKKQTLLVSVTPFGEDTKRYTTSRPVANDLSNKNAKEEKSLLDEISETLEKSNNSILGPRKTSIREEPVSNESNKENVIMSEMKSPELVNKVERKINLSRTPALKSKDLEKPVIYQTSIARIELLNTKNNKLSRESLNLKDKNNNTTEESESITPTSKTITANPSPVPPQSREQAGKPDGREDPECPEVPALPLTLPPPLENQSSFLHPPQVPEKPKVPSKPSTGLIRKPPPIVQHQVGQTLSTFIKQPLTKQDSGNDADPKNKRKAPKPPEEASPVVVAPLFTRNSPNPTSGDSPVVREKEKRERNERANSCAPKVFFGDMGDGRVSGPAPTPRKTLSISTDNLVCSDEKRKSKGRFSLRKFLRMGSSKDLPRLPIDSPSSEDRSDVPRPKPRLVIVHPSELNGAKVQVVAKPDQIDGERGSKATKPPPPPRNYEHWKPHVNTCPPPPKSAEVLTKLALSRSNSSSSTGTNKPKSESVYANIGEVRSSIVPNKPVRTASMREREAQQQMKQMQLQKPNIYEPIVNAKLKSSDNSENVYEYLRNGNRSSSPSSDGSGKNSPKSKTARLNKRSESSIDVSTDYFKFGNIPRSMSLTYCGSETESEIYAPYSCYGSETEVTEDDRDWAVQTGRTHKLRSRKGRSIVHKNLEDNYGAVVVANHEALAQVLENIQQTFHVQPALRGLKMSQNLRLQDFSLKRAVAPITIGSKAFHQALWGAQHVTLLFSTGIGTGTINLGSFNLNSVTEFSDLVESGREDKKLVQGTISVLPWLQVHTIESYGEHLRSKSEQEDDWRDSFFVMLQLVNALKMLQAQGIEELALTLSSFVLAKEVDRETHFRLCILQGTHPSELTSPEEKYGSLCTCASKALTLLQPASKTTSLLQSLLVNERSVSLTQVKSVLEFSLWGPTDVSLGSNVRERELTLQRWLDLQRATVLHGLVCTRVQLTVYEECHLLFLVRSNARMMSDASMLIESNNHKYTQASKA